ncbi:TRAFAC clade GTPase domain-containing protein [Acinetobacter variabilis]|uniref:Double-GTPase 2 domain-containing protein n=1 Tax=Acinetobacter variabilis TaxID=70346 RepID=N8WVP5_9GAMM|nr:GTPase domain-containing protein [Acinetobacter variabilis]ENU99362.1 hypothetical protein F969_01681 [Acinetobacter variabilis]
MLYTCERTDCDVKNCIDDGETPCMHGDSYQDCPYNKLIDDENESSEDDEIIENEINFQNILSGRNLIKYDDIKYFGLEVEPSIATLIGLPNSGKTSLLTSMLYTLRMNNEEELNFMGSSTLNAWSHLINLTLYAYGNTPRHPERTIDKADTHYLHLLINKDNKGYDLFLGDTAGEIFSGIVDNFNEESQEYQRIKKWIVESNILLICLDSLDYYTENLWVSKENHMIFIDRIYEIVNEYNPKIRIIFIQTKYDMVENNHENFQYHEEVNEYFIEKFKNNLVSTAKTISITAKQGIPPQDIDKILATCIGVLSEKPINEDPVVIKEGISKKVHLIQNCLEEWIS